MRQHIAFIAIFTGFAFNNVAAQQPTRQTRITFDEVVKREDTNADGKVTKDEFKGPARLFERLDRDAAGILTRQDFAGPPAQPGRNTGKIQIPDDVELHRNVVFGKGGDRDLTMHIVVPKTKPVTASPVYVWIHGGGWQSGNKDGGVGQVIPMVQRGFVGATIEYRLTGEAPFPAQIEDCKCAIRFLRAHADTYNIDPKRIAVGGSSAGGHLAALVGTSGDVKELEGTGGWQDQSSTVQAVVDLYGPTDFGRFVSTKGYERHNEDGSPESKLLGGGVVLNNPEGIIRVNPITYIDKADPPFLIIHGDVDRTVPLNQSQVLHSALEANGVSAELIVIESAGHGGPEFAKPEIRSKQLNFVSELLSNDN